MLSCSVTYFTNTVTCVLRGLAESALFVHYIPGEAPGPRWGGGGVSRGTPCTVVWVEPLKHKLVDGRGPQPIGLVGLYHTTPTRKFTRGGEGYPQGALYTYRTRQPLAPLQPAMLPEEPTPVPAAGAA